MKNLGYIVVNEGLANAMVLVRKSGNGWKDVPPGGILLQSREASVFPTRRAAVGAIARTVKYFNGRASFPSLRSPMDYVIRRLYPA